MGQQYWQLLDTGTPILWRLCNSFPFIESSAIHASTLNYSIHSPSITILPMFELKWVHQIIDDSLHPTVNVRFLYYDIPEQKCPNDSCRKNSGSGTAVAIFDCSIMKCYIMHLNLPKTLKL